MNFSYLLLLGIVVCGYGYVSYNVGFWEGRKNMEGPYREGTGAPPCKACEQHARDHENESWWRALLFYTRRKDGYGYDYKDLRVVWSIVFTTIFVGGMALGLGTLIYNGAQATDVSEAP